MIVTNDGKVTFEIINKVTASQEKVNQIKKEILDAYRVVTKSIETDYIPAEKISVHLLRGNAASSGFRKDVKLYSIWENEYPLVHELTHTLLGYGVKFDSSRGYVTQEGFGIYMENKFGKLINPVHKYMKYLIEHNKNIPLPKLMDKEYDFILFRPQLIDEADYALQTMSYIHAGSFVTFLIDTYGLDKFEQVFNQKELSQKFEQIYHKTTEELEKEWLEYIKVNAEFTSDDRIKLDAFYLINSNIDLINPEIFKRQ